MNEIKPGLYKHFKGNNYLVISTVVDSENEALFVLYSAESDKENRLWIRPAEMFASEVETSEGIKPRFLFLRDLNDEEKQVLKRQLFIQE